MADEQRETSDDGEQEPDLVLPRDLQHAAEHQDQQADQEPDHDDAGAMPAPAEPGGSDTKHDRPSRHAPLEALADQPGEREPAG